jgi:hypothetical protein
MIRSASRGKVNRTPTRTRESDDADSCKTTPSSRGKDGSGTERSPGLRSRPRHPVADLMESNEAHDNLRKAFKKKSSSGSTGKKTVSSSDRNLGTLFDNLNNQPSESAPAPVDGVGTRRTTKKQASDSSLGQPRYQRPSRQIKPSSSLNEERKVTRKKAVPDLYILQQLCWLQKFEQRNLSASSLSIGRLPHNAASDVELWTTLHTRYGNETYSMETRDGKIMILLQLLKLCDDVKCYEPSWILLSTSTKQAMPPNEPSVDGFVRRILVGISTEFDREQTNGSNAKKLAALTLYNMLKAEEHSFDSRFLSALQAMSTTRRQRWIAVLLDTLMFQDEEQQEQQQQSGGGVSGDDSGTTEILYVVWNLLVSQPVEDRENDDKAGEEGLLMQTIVGIIVTILSSECSVYGLPGNDEVASSGCVHLAETALGLLATVVSRGGVVALSGRQFECLKMIRETMDRHPLHDVQLQAANATCHILTHFIMERDTNVEGSEEGSDMNVRFVEQVVHIVKAALHYEKEWGSAEFSSATCRLLTVLLEADEDFLRLVVDTELMQGSMIVQSLLRMMETGSDIGVVECASDILVFTMDKVSPMIAHVRQTDNIASLLIQWMSTYESSPFVQEQLCLIIEHLVGSEDHAFGREIGAFGGLLVMGDFLLLSLHEGTLIEAAARALVGVLATVDDDILLSQEHALVEAVVACLTNHLRILELQLAGLEVLRCLCLRADYLKSRLAMVIPVVTESMLIHLGSADVLTKCCAVIRMVSLTSDSWSVIARTGAVKIIIDAVAIYPSCTEFVVEAMAALKDLASNECLRDHFESVEAETAVVSLLSFGADNPEFLSLAFATLNNIVVDSRTRSVATMQTFVLNEILAALDRFADESDVARNGCLLLKSYTYDPNNLDAMKQVRDDLLPMLEGLSTCSTEETRERAVYILGKL